VDLRRRGAASARDRDAISRKDHVVELAVCDIEAAVRREPGPPLLAVVCRIARADRDSHQEEHFDL